MSFPAVLQGIKNSAAAIPDEGIARAVRLFAARTV